MANPAIRPFAVSRPGVQDLLATGRAQLVKAVKPQPPAGEMPATIPYAVGEHFWGRESVAKHQGRFYYEADGREPGLFYQKNYHMPREACRLHLVVTAEQLELRGEEWVAVVDVQLVPEQAEEATLVPASGLLYLLDFEAVGTAARGFRKKPVFQVKELENATTDALHSDTVKYNAYCGQGEWRLDLTDFSIRDWLRKLQFTKEPCVLVGGQRIMCGKELAPG